MTQPSDPTIEEIREVRHQISQRFDHDPARLVGYYIALQEQYRDRLLDPIKEAARGDKSTESAA